MCITVLVYMFKRKHKSHLHIVWLINNGPWWRIQRIHNPTQRTTPLQRLDMIIHNLGSGGPYLDALKVHTVSQTWHLMPRRETPTHTLKNSPWKTSPALTKAQSISLRTLMVTSNRSDMVSDHYALVSRSWCSHSKHTANDRHTTHTEWTTTNYRW